MSNQLASGSTKRATEEKINPLRQAAKWLVQVTRRDWLAILLYAGAAILLTYPLILHLTDNWLVVSNDLAMKLWDVWWFDQIVTKGHSLFHTPNVYYPVGLDLSYYPMSWTATPFIWALSRLVGVFPAYKIQILSGLVVTGYSAYLLIVYLTQNRAAAWAGGAIYAFAPYHMSHTTSHPDLALLGTIPLTLFFFLISVERGSLWVAVAAGLMLGLTAWTGVYLLGFAAMTIGPVILFMMLHKSRWRQRQFWLLIGVFAVCGGILAAGRMWPILSNELDLQSAAEQKENLGGDNIAPISYLIPSSRNPLFALMIERLRIEVIDMSAGQPPYLGVVPLILSIMSLTRRGQKKNVPPAWLWLIVAVLFSLMALGPTLRVLDEMQPDIWLPASILHDLIPLVRGVRPHYYHLGLLLPLAVLAGIGLRDLLETLKEKPRIATSVAAVLIAWLLFEYWGDFYNEADANSEALAPSEFHLRIANQAESFAVLDLPINRASGKWQMYYQSIHHHPISGGTTGRFSGEQDRYLRQNFAANQWMEERRCQPGDYIPAQQAMDNLVADGFRYVVIQKRWTRDDFIVSYLGDTAVFEDEDIRVYELPHRDRTYVCGLEAPPPAP